MRRRAAAAAPIHRPRRPDLLGFGCAPLTSSPPSFKASPALRDGLMVLLAAAALLSVYGASVRLGPALADEFIYLSGARHFAGTGRLDARYYDAAAIIARGHPHHAVHAPGYVILLGAFDRLAGATNAAAIALNVISYAAASLLVYALARGLGVERARARTAAVLALLLPGVLPYVFWAMAETVLTALVLGALALAARDEDDPKRAAAAGLVLGLAFLVRESALFALPATLALLRGRARRAALVAFAAFALFVYAPLSRGRAPAATGRNRNRPRPEVRTSGRPPQAPLSASRPSRRPARATSAPPRPSSPAAWSPTPRSCCPRGRRGRREASWPPTSRSPSSLSSVGRRCRPVPGVTSPPSSWASRPWSRSSSACTSSSSGAATVTRCS